MAKYHSPNTFTCTQCNSTFNIKREAKYVKTIHHLGDDYDGYECPGCDQVVWTAGDG